MRLNYSKIFLSGIFITLSAVLGKESGDIPYAIFAGTVAITLFLYLASSWPRSDTFTKKSLDKSCIEKYSNSLFLLTLKHSWIFILLSWIYGVVLGLLLHDNVGYVFRNFFGLTLYITVPLLLLIRPSPKSVVTLIFFAGIFQMLSGIFYSHEFLLSPASFIITSSLSDIRTFYNTAYVGIFPIYSVCLAYHFSGMRSFGPEFSPWVQKLIKSKLFFLIATYALLIPAASKGFLLAAGLLLFFAIFLFLVKLVQDGKARIYSLTLSLFLIVVMAMLSFKYYELLAFTYSSDEIANAPRSEQYEYLANEISFFGAGLGAPLQSGYSRDETGYGFELTYVNLIHKIGIMSLFLFASYLITLFLGLQKAFSKSNSFLGFMCIGLMGYLIVGAGNPVLLSPTGVILHSLSIYLLVKIQGPLGRFSTFQSPA